MNDNQPEVLTKQQLAERHALQPLQGDQTLKFALVVGGDRIEGREVPFSNFRIGDMTDQTRHVEDFLTRLLGMDVKIETGE